MSSDDVVLWRPVIARRSSAWPIAATMAVLGGVLLGWGWSNPATAETSAVLGGLDKVTARVSTLLVPLGRPVRWGSLEIIAQFCEKHPPEEPPETAAFLEISEYRADAPPVRLFTGWMLASSPALNPLEHPVYDVWVIDCKTDAPESSRPTP